jgi:hypothetical protein
MRLALTALVVLLAAPVALAQSRVDVSVTPFPGPVVPADGPARTNVTVRIACGDLPREGTLSLSAQHREAWITTTIDPAEAHPDAAACDGEYALDATLTATLAPDAPAFEESVVQVGALLRGGRDALVGSQAIRVKAGFYGAVRLEAAKTTATGAAGNVVTFPIVVTNLGNGLAKVGFDLAAKNGSVQVPLPPSVVIEPFANATVQAQAIVPKSGGSSDFTLVATPAYAYDPALTGASAAVVLTVHREASVPASGVAAALAALALAHFRRPLR